MLFCFLLILFNKPYFLPICTDIESTYPLYQAIINLQFILCNITVPLSFKIRQIRITKLLTLSKAKLNVFSFASFLVMLLTLSMLLLLPWWLSSKESACQCRRHQFNPWVRKIPWRRKWQPTPVFLPGITPWTEEPSGRYSPRVRKRVAHNLATIQHHLGLAQETGNSF